MKPELDKIIRTMAERHGHDLAAYDETFLLKTLEKRFAATSAESPTAYCARLAEDRAEAGLFMKSLDIAHSEFFRNPLTFSLLEQRILPGLVADAQRSGKTLRIWSAGCAAGQEAYSIAILLDELSSRLGNAFAYRIFATSRSVDELAAARRGVYDVADVGKVRLEHIQRHFSVRGDVYELDDRIRRRVGFSEHDLLDGHAPAPAASIYGDFDLAFCCNLLFYYRTELRRHILDRLRRAIRPSGYLAVGEVEAAMVAQHGSFRAVAPATTVFRTTK